MPSHHWIPRLFTDVEPPRAFWVLLPVSDTSTVLATSCLQVQSAKYHQCNGLPWHLMEGKVNQGPCELNYDKKGRRGGDIAPHQVNEGVLLALLVENKLPLIVFS